MTAARLDGASTRYIIWYAVVPNILPLLVSEVTRALSIAILDIAALGFLNLARSYPPPSGACCWVIRWNWSMPRPGR